MLSFELSGLLSVIQKQGHVRALCYCVAPWCNRGDSLLLLLQLPLSHTAVNHVVSHSGVA